MTMPPRVILTTLVLLAATVLVGCSTNPATGKRTFMLQTWEWERALAAEAGPQFTDEFGGETPDATAQGYVDEVGGKLTRAALEQAFAEVPELEWDYTLLDSAVLNAFALPGGKVYISRGLAEKLENEAQLAGVLGHEVGHVMARHGNQRISKQIGMNVALGAAAVAVGVADEDSGFGSTGSTPSRRSPSGAMSSCSATAATRNSKPTAWASSTWSPTATTQRDNAR